MKKTRRNLLVVVIMVFALAFTLVIPSTAQAAKAKRLKVKSAPKKIEVGKTAKIKTNIPAGFLSSNKSIATVNKKGVITAKNEGTVVITVYNKKRIMDQKKVNIKITPRKANPDPQPSSDNITVEYKGKVPLGANWGINEYGAIVKEKNADGTETIVNPDNYSFSCKDIVEKDGKLFAECLLEYGDIYEFYYVEIIDTQDTIPLHFEAIYPEGKILKQGEIPSVKDIDAYISYKDGRKEKIDSANLRVEFDKASENDEGDIVHYYYIIYEQYFDYNGERLYDSCVYPLSVKYEMEKTLQTSTGNLFQQATDITI